MNESQEHNRKEALCEALRLRKDRVRSFRVQPLGPDCLQHAPTPHFTNLRPSAGYKSLNLLASVSSFVNGDINNICFRGQLINISRVNKSKVHRTRSGTRKSSISHRHKHSVTTPLLRGPPLDGNISESDRNVQCVGGFSGPCQYPDMACVASWSAGGELGSVSRQQGWASEDAARHPELAAGRRPLQPSEVELQLCGQTLLCCIFVVSSL